MINHGLVKIFFIKKILLSVEIERGRRGGMMLLANSFKNLSNLQSKRLAKGCRKVFLAWLAHYGCKGRQTGSFSVASLVGTLLHYTARK